MIGRDRKTIRRAKRARARHRAPESRQIAARVRVGPELSDRTTTNDPSLTVRPFESAVSNYRQTPESWLDVWSEDKE